MSLFLLPSLILGLLSPLLLCVCGLSLISSLAAVVTGHLALLQIGRSAGRLSGRGLAITGLVLGYVLLATSLGVWALFGSSLYQGWRNAERQAAGPGSTAAPESSEQRLLAAEMRVLTRGSERVASGNSPQARQLAEDYSQSLQTMREAEFTASRDRVFSLTAAEFIVHCERHPERCAFIVHVPAYRDFDDDAKSELELRAWQLAQETVADVPDAGDSLAVGLRGTALYDRPTCRSPKLATTGRGCASCRCDAPQRGRPRAAFPDMGWTAESLAFAPQGRYLAAGKLDALLLLLDVETGQRLQSVSLREELGQIPCVAFSLDGGKLFAGGDRGKLHAWDVDDAGRLQPAASLQGHARAVTCLAASPAAPFLLSGSAAGDLVWQSYERASADARQLAAFERSVLAVHLPHRGMLAWATDGRRLIQFDLGTAQIVQVRELRRTGSRLLDRWEDAGGEPGERDPADRYADRHRDQDPGGRA